MNTFDRSHKSQEQRLIALVLTGPPAAGKTTITELLADHGIPTVDTGELIRDEARMRSDDETEVTEDTCWSVARELRSIYGDMAPTCLLGDGWLQEQRTNDEDIICVSAVRNEAEVDWLRDHVDTVLVVRVCANYIDRMHRYVEMNIDTSMDRASVSEDRVNELREQLAERERRERPYPQSDVRLNAGDTIRFGRLTEQLSNIVAALRA